MVSLNLAHPVSAAPKLWGGAHSLGPGATNKFITLKSRYLQDFENFCRAIKETRSLLKTNPQSEAILYKVSRSGYIPTTAVPTKSESIAGRVGSVHDFGTGRVNWKFAKTQRPDAIVPYDQRRRQVCRQTTFPISSASVNDIIESLVSPIFTDSYNSRNQIYTVDVLCPRAFVA